MPVNLYCFDGVVAEHFAHQVEVSRGLKQAGCKRMMQSVRTEAFIESGMGGVSRSKNLGGAQEAARVDWRHASIFSKKGTKRTPVARRLQTSVEFRRIGQQSSSMLEPGANSAAETVVGERKSAVLNNFDANNATKAADNAAFLASKKFCQQLLFHCRQLLL